MLWTFDDKRKMKQVFSSPVFAGNRLYIGEGFHQDAECRVLCLDAARGEKLWEHAVDSHTESTPCVIDGKVYCGAGDDGLLCLTAETGEKVWNFPSFHIDTCPVVRGSSIFAGCGIGDTFRETALFCLDASTGQPRWRYPTDLPVWSRPVAGGGFVFAGIGNGRLNESDERPAGAVLCLRETDGAEVWKRRLPDGVLGRLEADRRHLFFGCRDGFFYCLRRSDGALVWRRGMGSAVVAGPAVQMHPSGEAAAERLYAASVGGYLACLDPATGKLLWGRDLADRSKSRVELIATPALEVRAESDGREVKRLYVALTLISTGRVGELRCYEERPAAE
jgi:outer membrane protein assembly factor BamB